MDIIGIVGIELMGWLGGYDLHVYIYVLDERETHRETGSQIERKILNINLNFCIVKDEMIIRE